MNTNRQSVKKRSVKKQYNRPWLHRLLVVAKVWGLLPLLAGGAVSLLVWKTVVDPVKVFGRGELSWVVTPLVPSICVSVVPVQSRIATLPIEHFSLQPAWQRRAAFVSLVLTVSLSSAVLGVGMNHMVFRNVFFLTGLALLSTTVLPAGINWAPPVLFPIVTWLIGTPAIDMPLPAWAVLLHPAQSNVALFSTFLVMGVGCGLFLFRPRKGNYAGSR